MVDDFFDDTVKLCEFYADESTPMRVDYENRCVHLAGFIVEPDAECGYLVKDPMGIIHPVNDLDFYFQEVFEWGYRN